MHHGTCMAATSGWQACFVSTSIYRSQPRFYCLDDAYAGWLCTTAWRNWQTGRVAVSPTGPATATIPAIRQHPWCQTPTTTICLGHCLAYSICCGLRRFFMDYVRHGTPWRSGKALADTQPKSARALFLSFFLPRHRSLHTAQVESVTRLECEKVGGATAAWPLWRLLSGGTPLQLLSVGAATSPESAMPVNEAGQAVVVAYRLLYLRALTPPDAALLGGMGRLRVLDLSGSTVQQLPESFSNLTCLQHLDLSYCRTRDSFQAALAP